MSAELTEIEYNSPSDVEFDLLHYHSLVIRPITKESAALSNPVIGVYYFDGQSEQCCLATATLSFTEYTRWRIENVKATRQGEDSGRPGLFCNFLAWYLSKYLTSKGFTNSNTKLLRLHLQNLALTQYGDKIHSRFDVQELALLKGQRNPYEEWFERLIIRFDKEVGDIESFRIVEPMYVEIDALIDININNGTYSNNDTHADTARLTRLLQKLDKKITELSIERRIPSKLFPVDIQKLIARAYLNQSKNEQQ